MNQRKGWDIFAKIAGPEGIRNAEGLRAFFPAMEQAVVELGYGEFYPRPQLNYRQRAVATLAALCAIGSHQPLEFHIRAALQVGLSQEEILEVFLHCALYAGFPRALEATQLAQVVFQAYNGGQGQMNAMDMVQGLYEAFDRGDMPDVLGRLSPDIEWLFTKDHPYENGDIRGIDAVVQHVFMRLGGEWESFQVIREQLYAAGDEVVMVGKYRGRHKETGRELDTPTTHVWTFQDGKIARMQQFTDTSAWRTAVSYEAR